MLLESGQLVLGREYRVEELIGIGPYTRVYRATHIDLLSPRALKVVHLDTPGIGPTEIEAFRRRFRRQTLLGARMSHPNLIHVEEFRQEGNALVLVMEYAAGMSLADRIRNALETGHSIPIDQVVATALDVGAGLAAIHGLGGVHGSVKPSNVLFGDSGTAKLTDLGPALVPGEPVDLGPEDDTFGSDLTAWSDMSGLGAVLFEMLSGRAIDEVPLGTRVRALRTDVPDWLDDLVALLLAADPRHTPRNGSEFVDMLSLGKQAAALAAQEAAEQAWEEKRQSETREAGLELPAVIAETDSEAPQPEERRADDLAPQDAKPWRVADLQTPVDAEWGEPEAQLQSEADAERALDDERRARDDAARVTREVEQALRRAAAEQARREVEAQSRVERETA